MSDITEFQDIRISDLSKDDLIRLVAKINQDGRIYIVMQTED